MLKKATTYNYPPTFSLVEKLKHLPRLANHPIEVINGHFASVGEDTYYIATLFNGFKIIITQDAGFAEHVLQKNNKNYHKSPILSQRMQKYIGNGLLTANGNFWLRQRRLIQPGFNKSAINSLTHLFTEEATKFLDHLPLNKKVDLHLYTSAFSFNVIAKALFSKELDADRFEHFRSQSTQVQQMFTREMRKPYLKWKYHLFGDIIKHLSMAKEMRGFLIEIIEERRKSQDSFDDLLDMLLNARYEDTGEPMSDEQLIDEILILFVAGQETTSNALAWTIYLLNQNPKEKEKLVNHLQQHTSSSVNYKDILADTVSLNIIQESMRLYPPAWIVDRISLTDDEYEKYSFPKDTHVAIFVYGLHRHPSLWEDPEMFNPQRFIENPFPKYYIPFGAGPRMCIGNHFSLLEMIIFLQNLYKKYDIEIVAPEKVNMKTLVTLQPENLKAIFRLRK